ncbi:MAG: hypothetical protein KOO63_02680 [Bacteroidales bacterium]|nr:hypothetical protein [Candidatus Latescibacterota bacterium]
MTIIRWVRAELLIGNFRLANQELAPDKAACPVPGLPRSAPIVFAGETNGRRSVMDIGKILGDIKGKVLDSQHFDLLRHAYDLQEQNLEQFRQNNAALRESRDLLKEKNERLEVENSQLAKKVNDLGQLLPKQDATAGIEDLSEIALSILKVFHAQDKTRLDEYDIFDLIEVSKIKGKSGLDELSSEEYIRFSSAGPRGLDYYLTEKARKLLAKWE